ncbi:MAG TPA: hypothetical protein VFT65_01745 [Candidatus Angelobacter sp.]|nr:hypothetical protein [Candidatus Angelobacter sp.]
MKSPSLQSLTAVLIFAIAAVCLPFRAFAACPAPASGHVAICQPSANSIIYQVPHIEAVANPSAGSINTMKVYIDGKQIFQNAGPDISLFEGGVANGTHHLVINAWDSFGHLYQAQESFSVAGNLPFSCPPSAVGVRICAPGSGQVVSQNLGFSAGFRGNTAIKHIRAYVDSKDVFDYAPASGQTSIVAGGVNTTAGTHTLSLVAWDANNAVYKSSVVIKTFYEGGCPPLGTTCNPGIYPNTPNDGDDVQSPFRASASVQYNTATITAMKVYVDGIQAGASSGPTLDQPVTAAKGTHIVVIQAWDTAGKLYRLSQNVNVQ